MSFKLINAPTTFQAMINDTLKMMLNRFAMAYLDDITIYSKTMEKHVVHIKKVLEALANRSLRLKTNKYEFHKKKIEYLGYIVGREGIKMSPKKIQRIMKWPTLTIIKKILSFTESANFN